MKRKKFPWAIIYHFCFQIFFLRCTVLVLAHISFRFGTNFQLNFDSESVCIFYFLTFLNFLIFVSKTFSKCFWYKRCPYIRRLIWHQNWRVRVDGWRVWRVATWRDMDCQPPTRPFLSANFTLVFFVLVTRFRIILFCSNLVQKKWPWSQKCRWKNWHQ